MNEGKIPYKLIKSYNYLIKVNNLPTKIIKITGLTEKIISPDEIAKTLGIGSMNIKGEIIEITKKYLKIIPLKKTNLHCD